jgi:hypothetical protein
MESPIQKNKLRNKIPESYEFNAHLFRSLKEDSVEKWSN